MWGWRVSVQLWQDGLGYLKSRVVNWKVKEQPVGDVLIRREKQKVAARAAVIMLLFFLQKDAIIVVWHDQLIPNGGEKRGKGF